MKKDKDKLKATLERMEVKLYCDLMNRKHIAKTMWTRYDKYVAQYNKMCPQNTTYQIQTYGGLSKIEYTTKEM